MTILLKEKKMRGLQLSSVSVRERSRIGHRPKMSCASPSQSGVVPNILVGICAMAKKAQSRPMTQMIERLKTYFLVYVFPEPLIFCRPIEDWPIVNALIAFYSSGYPLEKVQSYVRLRNPFVLNDLEMQKVLVLRTKVYETLKRHQVDVPRYAVVWRDEIHPKANLIENEDKIVIDGVEFKKPFVEKPVSSEDHNIIVYFPMSAGGGSRQLFRKIHNESSTFSKEGGIRRGKGSFIYEDFLPTNGIDIKVYAVGPYHAYAEARAAPSLGGKVNRNTAGKEERFPVLLTSKEKWMARQVVLAFKQTVCGFDLLRSTKDNVSYVCDVNGFSFVKASTKYYDHTAKILRHMIRTKLLTENAPAPLLALEDKKQAPTPMASTEELRCVLAVIRHGDRTPKQKLKMPARHEKWTELFESHQQDREQLEIKLKKPEHLQACLDIARFLLTDARATLSDEEASKMEQMKTVLEM